MILKYTDRAAFLHAVASLSYTETSYADPETGPLPSDDLDSDVRNVDDEIVGGWWQMDGYPNPVRWEGELATEGADEWVRHTHQYEGPTETEMADQLRSGS